MQLSSIEDRHLLRSWEQLENQPTPYLSPLICPAFDDPLRKQEYLPDLNLEPQQNTSKQQTEPIGCIHSQEREYDSIQLSDSKLHLDQLNKAQQLKTQAIFPLLCQSKAKSLIYLLVENNDLTHEQLQKHGEQIYGNELHLKEVFQILLAKFKKIRKTKQEMTKYCMRKAFKFVNDLKNTNKNVSIKKKNSHKIDQDQQSQCIFQVPFKKNSSQKTMNVQFLKQIFNNQEFLDGYKKFLKNFHEMIRNDNNYKVQFLCQTIQQRLKAKDFKKIQSLKRLPWPKTILTKTQHLANQLLDYAKEQPVLQDKSHKLPNDSY